MRTFCLSQLFALCLAVCGCAGMPAPDPAVVAGDTATKASQFRSAIGHYTRALDSGALEPDRVVEGYMKRANAYWQEAEFNTMADADLIAGLFDTFRVRLLAPDFVQAIDLQATLYERLGAYPEALSLYKVAYVIDQSNPFWSFINIGATYRMMGDYDNALRFYNRVFEIPGFEPGMAIYYHRALTFFFMGRYQEAIESLTEGLKYQEDYPFAYIYRACAYARIGDYSRAASDYGAGVAIWRAAEPEYGHTTVWKTTLERMAVEDSALSALSRNATAAVAPARFCEEFPSYARYRERSNLLSAMPALDAREARFDSLVLAFDRQPGN